MQKTAIRLAKVKRLLSIDHFSVYGRLIEAWGVDEKLQAQDEAPA